MHRFWKYFLFFHLFAGSICAHEWYSEYWQRMLWNVWSNPCLSFSLYGEIETGNHFKDIRYYHISAQFTHQLSNRISLGLNYTYIYSRPLIDEDGPWKWHQRLEFDLNRIFHVWARNYISTRNRLEVRKIEGNPQIGCRLRQRTMLVIPIKGRGWLKEYDCYNEIFFDIPKHRVVRDRICPIDLTFALSKTTELDVFTLLELFEEQGIWYKSFILGSQVTF